MEETHRANVSEQEVIQKYFNMVYKLALSRCRNQSYADDITQTVFLKYLQNHDRLQSEDHIKAWLIRVTINCSKSLFLSSWFQRTSPLNEDILFETDGKSDVYYAVMELDMKYRTVIHLHYYEDMSVGEIAEVLKIKEGTVKSRLFRGREMLRKKLEGGIDFV